MGAIIDAIKRAFLWTFPTPNSAVTLVIGTALGVFLDRSFNAIVDRIGRPAREREQTKRDRERMEKEREHEERVRVAAKEGAIEGVRQYEKWHQVNPGQQMPDPVLEQIIEASTTTVIKTLTNVVTPNDPVILTEGNARMTRTLGTAVPLPGPYNTPLWLRAKQKDPGTPPWKEEPPKK